MKYISIFALGILNLVSYGQTEVEKGSYQFTEDFIADLSPLKIKGSSKKVEIEEGSKVKVVGMSDDLKKVYIKYWSYPEKIKSRDGLFKEATFTDNPKAKTFNEDVFELSSEFFKKITIPLYSRYKGATVGVYTVPFRLRGIGDNFDFESSLSLQANLVAGFGRRTNENSWLDCSIGLGLTGVGLTPQNSNVIEQRTASAFTISSGIVFKPSKVANIGLFVGWDNLGSNDRDVGWTYNGDMWLGLGLNISFNAITTDKSAIKDAQ